MPSRAPLHECRRARCFAAGLFAGDRGAWMLASPQRFCAAQCSAVMSEYPMIAFGWRRSAS
jgi:hypothetical protein